MSYSLKFAFLSLAAWAVLFTGGIAAQESATAPKQAAPRPPLTEQQKRGEALFVQNCPLCHVPSGQKKGLGIQGPSLQGVFSEDSDENELRQFIQQGVPKMMPGFRYDLDSKQIDDLIAFLKSGAYLKVPGVSN